MFYCATLLLYAQVVASTPSVRLTASEAKVPLEREWKFSEASPGALRMLAGAVCVTGSMENVCYGHDSICSYPSNAMMPSTS
jgi:hypothetical protein